MPAPASPEDFAAVRLLVLDVDGVLTDGVTVYGEQGEVAKHYYKPDGLGIVVLQRAGVAVAVMTTEEAGCVRSRVEDLKIRHYFPGCKHKGESLKQLCKVTGIEARAIAYIGDDINDIAAMTQVGLPIATPDARPEVRSIARHTTRATGGHGAVREVCDVILKAKGLDPVELWERG